MPPSLWSIYSPLFWPVGTTSTRLVVLSVAILAIGPALPAPAQCFSAGQGSFQFDSEFVSIHIERDSVRVEGTYLFLCPPSGAPKTLLYPYPADSLLGGARTVELVSRTHGGDWRPMKYVEIPGRYAARWLLPPCEGDTLEIRTVYRQARTTSYARYIVTTVHGWDNPVRQAVFEIHLPPGAEPVRMSYPFQARRKAGNSFYRYDAADFLPDRDITITWRKEE